MRRLILVAVVGLLACACGGGDDNPQASPTTVTTTTLPPTTTTEPTTTEEPTTTKAKVDDAAREGCKQLANAKDNDGIRRAIIFLSLSLNDDFSGPANEFVDADNGGHQRKAYRALADLNIACHAAGLL